MYRDIYWEKFSKGDGSFLCNESCADYFSNILLNSVLSENSSKELDNAEFDKMLIKPRSRISFLLSIREMAVVIFENVNRV